jgi:hypothetical protein
MASGYTKDFLGISLLVSALIQSKTLSFYQMHIIYDTTSLVMYVHREFAHFYSLETIIILKAFPIVLLVFAYLQEEQLRGSQDWFL